MPKKKKKLSENDLTKLYRSCLLFKSYCQYNLWSGDFDEYDNIKYCNKYIQKYIYYWINIFLLERFSLSFVIFLYKNPCFIKFVESGFLKYLDYHFFLSFYNNCSIFNLKGKLSLEFFVKSYFQIFLKNRFEKDLLILIIKVINDTILKFLIKYLINRLKYFKFHIRQVWLNKATILKLIEIQDKKVILFIKLLYLIKKYYYKLFFTNLNFVYKSLLKFINFKNNKNLNLVKSSKLIKKKNFIRFSLKTLHFSNKDIQYLIESGEDLNGFQEKSIGLYINFNILFKDCLVQKFLLLDKINIKSFKNQFKTFDIYFVKYKYKRKF